MTELKPEDFGIKSYSWNSGRLDVNGNVYLSHRGLTKLPFNFGVVTGFFVCPHNLLTSLHGAPKEVRGHFDCSHNLLTSLHGTLPPPILGTPPWGIAQYVTVVKILRASDEWAVRAGASLPVPDVEVEETLPPAAPYTGTPAHNPRLGRREGHPGPRAIPYFFGRCRKEGQAWTRYIISWPVL